MTGLPRLTRTISSCDEERERCARIGQSLIHTLAYYLPDEIDTRSISSDVLARVASPPVDPTSSNVRLTIQARRRRRLRGRCDKSVLNIEHRELQFGDAKAQKGRRRDWVNGLWTTSKHACHRGHRCFLPRRHGRVRTRRWPTSPSIVTSHVSSLPPPPVVRIPKWFCQASSWKECDILLVRWRREKWAKVEGTPSRQRRISSRPPEIQFDGKVGIGSQASYSMLGILRIRMKRGLCRRVSSSCPLSYTPQPHIPSGVSKLHPTSSDVLTSSSAAGNI